MSLLRAHMQLSGRLSTSFVILCGEKKGNGMAMSFEPNSDFTYKRRGTHAPNNKTFAPVPKQRFQESVYVTANSQTVINNRYREN